MGIYFYENNSDELYYSCVKKNFDYKEKRNVIKVEQHSGMKIIYPWI